MRFSSRAQVTRKSDFTRRFLVICSFGLFGAAAAVGMASVRRRAMA